MSGCVRRNVVTNNAAVSCSIGIWYALSVNITGISVNIYGGNPRFQNVLNIPLSTSSDNVAHSCNNGFFVDNGPAADGSVRDSTTYVPLDPVTRAKIDAVFDRVTAYKCRSTGIWVRGDGTRVHNSFAADNAVGVRLLSGPVLFQDGVIIGVRGGGGELAYGADGHDAPVYTSGWGVHVIILCPPFLITSVCTRVLGNGCEGGARGCPLRDVSQNRFLAWRGVAWRVQETTNVGRPHPGEARSRVNVNNAGASIVGWRHYDVSIQILLRTAISGFVSNGVRPAGCIRNHDGAPNVHDPRNLFIDSSCDAAST